jgi:hypothetical protein
MKTFLCLLVLGIFILSGLVMAAGIPKMINLQGKLTDVTGTPVPDGQYSVMFAIYDDSTGGNVKWTETQMVYTSGGVFDVLLGSQTDISEEVFDDADRWLGITVESDPEMTPRQRLVSMPYGYKKGNLGPDSVIADVDSGGAFLARAGSAIGSGGLFGETNVKSFPGRFNSGVHGSAFTGTDRKQIGVLGQGATGPWGQLEAYGGYFNGLSIMAAAQTDAYGVFAQASGFLGTPDCDLYGGYFEAGSTDGVEYSSQGNQYGVYADVTGDDNTIGSQYGLRANVSGGGGSPFDQCGVYAEVSSGPNPQGKQYGLLASAAGLNSDETYGTYSVAVNAPAGLTYGGYFEALADGTCNHYGVYAISEGNTTCSGSDGIYGVHAQAKNWSDLNTYGGYFIAHPEGTGTHYGVYGFVDADDPNTSYAVFADGDFGGTGAKYAAVKTSRGHRLLSCMESPEIWFEDFGEGQLVSGKAHIELDPLFLETVTVNDEHPMKVFVQLKDDCRGVYVKTKYSGFDVFELQGGTSHAEFSYRVVAKRKGYEDFRLAEAQLGNKTEEARPENTGGSR